MYILLFQSNQVEKVNDSSYTISLKTQVGFVDFFHIFFFCFRNRGM